MLIHDSRPTPRISIFRAHYWSFLSFKFLRRSFIDWDQFWFNSFCRWEDQPYNILLRRFMTLFDLIDACIQHLFFRLRMFWLKKLLNFSLVLSCFHQFSFTQKKLKFIIRCFQFFFQTGNFFFLNEFGAWNFLEFFFVFWGEVLRLFID